MILAEAVNTVAVIFGPGLRQDGVYATGATDKQVLTKLKQAAGDKAAVSNKGRDLINAWLLRGYSLIVRNEHGDLIVYSNTNVQANDQVQNVFGLTATTPLWRFTRTANGQLVGSRVTGASLGIT